MQSAIQSLSTRWLSFLAPMLMALFSAVAGCDSKDAPSGGGNSPGSGGKGPISIVATTGMIADVVRNIAGDRAQVQSLMGEGVDPHLYRPTRSDMAALSRADIIFYNGLLLEGRMTDSLERIKASGKPVFAVADGIAAADLIQPAGFEGHPDPHIWMDPVLWSAAAAVIRDRLIETDPAGEAHYRPRAAAYIAELADLHAYAVESLASVPQSARAMVTAHDAFNYFGARYTFEVVGIQGISTESEAGVQDTERLVETLVSRKIPAVFVETTVSDRNINALIAGARARGHEVRIGGSLFSDAMGKPGTYEGTYIGMIDHNVTTVARALGGQAPEAGFRGKLSRGGAGGGGEGESGR